MLGLVKILFTAGAMWFVIGCSLTKTDLIKDGTVSLKIIPSNELRYFETDVRRDGGYVTVSGALNLDIPRTYAPLPGHMDVAVRSASGNSIFVGSAPYRRPHRNEFLTHAYFSITFDAVLPDGTIVTLRHHDKSVDVHKPPHPDISLNDA